MNISSLVQNWIISLFAIFISFSGLVLSLICIYTLPDQVTRPSIGAIFYFVAALILIFYFFFMWRKNKSLELKSIEANNDNSVLVIQESLSDRILKWIIAIYAMLFTFSGLCIALICIYSLPDKTVQPQTGILYFISGIIVLAVFVFVVWKNWISAQS